VTSFIGRLVDKEFRHSLKTTFFRKQLSNKVTVVPNFLVSTNTTSNYVSSNLTLFESLHLKVHNTQFILDSLIAVSFYLARNPMQPSEQPKRQEFEYKERSGEEVFSLDAEIMKESLKTDQLNDFFNECKS
jgi:hypothetical protein